MVDTTVTSIEDKLIDGLNFKMPSTSSYVTRRRSTKFYATGSNVYASKSGTRVIRININAEDEWLDPDSVRISMDVVNDDTTMSPAISAVAAAPAVLSNPATGKVAAQPATGKTLRFLSGPHGLFKRFRIMCQGQTLEDCDNYNAMCEMLQTLKSKHTRENLNTENFGPTYQDHLYNDIFFANKASLDLAGNIATASASDEIKVLRKLRPFTYPGIPGGQRQTVVFKPDSGILKVNKMLPLRFLPLILELELVSDPEEPILYTGLLADARQESHLSYPQSGFYTRNSSNMWHIENVCVLADLITLDSDLANKYYSHLLGGNSLSFNYSTMISQQQTIKDMKKPSINIARALSRLKTVFVTLEKDLFYDSINTNTDLDEYVNGIYKVDSAYSGYIHPGKKPWRTFWSPMASDNSSTAHADNSISSYQHNDEAEFKFSIQLGGQKFPESDINGHAQAFYYLAGALGNYVSDVHSIDITPRQYRSNRLILGMNMEKVKQSSFSGLNTRDGSLLTAKLEYNSNDERRWADRMNVYLDCDVILEIREGGITILE